MGTWGCGDSAADSLPDEPNLSPNLYILLQNGLSIYIYCNVLIKIIHLKSWKDDILNVIWLRDSKLFYSLCFSVFSNFFSIMRMYDLCKKGENSFYKKWKKKSKSGSLISCHTFEHWNIQQRVFYYNCRSPCVPLPHW